MNYLVTYIPGGASEPYEDRVLIETGDPDTDADNIIDEYDRRGHEVIAIQWSTTREYTYKNRSYLD